jgi:peptide/nickel transport system permease protein
MSNNLLTYIVRRICILIPILLVISMIIFVVIQLPPGDYVTSYIQSLQKQGAQINQEQIDALRHQYGLDLPMYQRYLKWIKDFAMGDLGRSFSQEESVNKLITDRLPLSILLCTVTILFTWLVSIPIALYSAVKKYSPGDYVLTFLGFLGLSVPSFFLAIVLMYMGFNYFGISIGGIYSKEFLFAPWSFAKFIDLLSHLWAPVLVLGIGGTAGTIRVLRASLLDELDKDYVRTARAKGISEIRVLVIHPLRVALNPLVSTIGWLLPAMIAGDVVVSKVLSLPTVGPLLLQSLLDQDMYLAGSILLIQAIFTVVGTLLSDILLGWIDPRIRYN